ncbi:MAG: hypothetical protein ABSH14_00650 [Verrucomicrobiia bacterium]|jgi:hypothetical protein
MAFWASGLSKIGGPITTLIVIGLVLDHNPSPGHLLPLSWDIGILVGTVGCIMGLFGIGALVGHSIWFLKYRSKESETASPSTAQNER